MALLLADEHSVLLWQTCALADDVLCAVDERRGLVPAFTAMERFLRVELLPYLDAEERDLPAAALRDEHLTAVLRADHDRIRVAAENVVASRTGSLLAVSAGELVDRLGRHVRREESWVIEHGGDRRDA